MHEFQSNKSSACQWLPYAAILYASSLGNGKKAKAFST